VFGFAIGKVQSEMNPAKKMKRPIALKHALALSTVAFQVIFATSSGAIARSSAVCRGCEHPVSVIEADIYVTRFKTTMRLRCFAEDLELIQGVEALEDGFYDLDELRDATQDHADYLAEHIHLHDVGGVRIPAQVTEIIDFEMPDEGAAGIRQGELMKYVIGFVLEFNYDQPPEFLTISQQVIVDGLLPSELKVLLKQEGSDEPFFQMMKPDQPETFRFDWTNPAPAGDASEQEWSSWFEEQREKTLGIASYSSVYSFIYITAYQVRHEILIPLATLNTFFEVDQSEPGFVDLPDQDLVAEKIKRFFAFGNAVEIDNIPVAPVFDRIDFYSLDLRDFAMQTERRKVSMANGRVGIILSYSTKGFPREVKVTWDKFNDVVKTVDSIVFAFDEIDQTEFSMFQDNNTFRWQSGDRIPPAPITEVAADGWLDGHAKLRAPMPFTWLAALAIPLIVVIPFCRRWKLVSTLAASLVAASVLVPTGQVVEYELPWKSRPQIADETALDVFSQLHKNLFRAFDYHSESDIYDALAHSVDGDLLQELYLKILDSLRIQEQGGAISQVQQVNLVTGHRLQDDVDRQIGFRIRSQWELVGTVEHWGHIHERKNTYDAEFRVDLVDRDWKITEMEILDYKPEAIRTSLRRLERS
jgi:hypothetical protein